MGRVVVCLWFSVCLNVCFCGGVFFVFLCVFFVVLGLMVCFVFKCEFLCCLFF